MTNEINLSSVVLDVTMPVDMLQDYVANAVIEDRAQCDADHLAELRAYELTVAHLREQLAQRGEPVAYIRRDQLQQARRSPMLCEVTTEPRQDCVAIFTHQQAPQAQLEQKKDIHGLDTDSNNPEPQQQRDVAGPLAMGQQMGNGSDAETGDSGSERAVALIRGIDEYGPMLDWFTHWAEFKVGTRLYVADPTRTEAQREYKPLTFDEWNRHPYTLALMRSMSEDYVPKIEAHQALQVPMTLDSVIDLVMECGLDWQKGFVPLFDGDPTNRFAVLVEAVEAHHGIKEQP